MGASRGPGRSSARIEAALASWAELHKSSLVFSPAVEQWFTRTFGAPTEVQSRGWPLIAAGENTLLHAATGSGKTLAAFLFCIDELMREPVSATHVLYLSPLRALAQDVARNLELP